MHDNAWAGIFKQGKYMIYTYKDYAPCIIFDKMFFATTQLK